MNKAGREHHREEFQRFLQSLQGRAAEPMPNWSHAELYDEAGEIIERFHEWRRMGSEDSIGPVRLVFTNWCAALFQPPLNRSARSILLNELNASMRPVYHPPKRLAQLPREKDESRFAHLARVFIASGMTEEARYMTALATGDDAFFAFSRWNRMPAVTAAEMSAERLRVGDVAPVPHNFQYSIDPDASGDASEVEDSPSTDRPDTGTPF